MITGGKENAEGPRKIQTTDFKIIIFSFKILSEYRVWFSNSRQERAYIVGNICSCGRE